MHDLIKVKEKSLGFEPVGASLSTTLALYLNRCWSVRYHNGMEYMKLTKVLQLRMVIKENSIKSSVRANFVNMR